jgi:hypothetical protein
MNPIGQDDQEEGGVSLLEGSDAAKKAFNWKHWVPVFPEFYRYHFGTDLLIASWLFLVSTVLWVAMESDSLSSDHIHRFIVAFNDECTLACAVLFLIGSIYFVFMSYPEEVAKMETLLQRDVNELTFNERYFTGRFLVSFFLMYN